MSLVAPAARLVAPVMASTPLSVIEPFAVTVRLPLTVDAPRSIAPVSTSVTFLPLTTLTAPPKLLAASSVMSLAEPAVRLVVPAIERLPLSVIEPFAVTARLPLTVEAPRSMAPKSLITTLLPLTTLTGPPKSLYSFSVMSLPEPAVRLVEPLTVRLSLSVIAPFAVTVRLPLISTGPMSMPLVSLSVTFLPLVTLTGPPNWFALSSVMSLAEPASSVVIPETKRSPLSVIEPLEVTVRLPLIVDAPRSSAPVSTSDTSLPLTTLTVPPKLLSLSSVMSLAAPALRLVVPETFTAPLSVIVPLAVTTRLPLIVEAPRSMAFVSLSVTFRPLVTLTAPAMLLAASSVMSLAAPALRVREPVMARAPLSVIDPLAFTVRSPLTVEAPRSMAPVSLSVTFLPLTTLTGPPKLLALVSAIVLPEPAARLVLPATVRALPESWLSVPLEVTAKLPLIVELPRMRLSASTSTTLLPLTTLTVPENRLAASREMLLAAPAVRKVASPTASTPLPVIEPLAVTVRLLPRVAAASVIAPVSLSVTSLALRIATAPPKSLASSSVMS